MKRTRLMSKLFSDNCPEGYSEKIQEKIEEAKDNGSATLDEEGEVLQFAADDEGNVVIEDQTDGADEVTLATENPDDPDDIMLSAVEIPDETEEEKVKEEENKEVETKVEGEEKEFAETIVPTVEISQLPGIDGAKAEEIIPEITIDVETGITDNGEKSGTNVFSLKFNNCTEAIAKRFTKVFSEVACPCMKAIEQAGVDEDVKVSFDEKGEMKVMSVKIGKQVKLFSEDKGEEKELDVTEVLNKASELAEMCKEGVDKDKAEEIKTKAEEVLDMAKDLEESGVKMECIKSMCSRFSEEADKVADEEEIKTEESNEEKSEEIKTESLNPQVIECDGKWCIEGDPEKRTFETQEEAEQEAAKSFSEPTATITINNLEAASVADLLKPQGANKVDDTKFENEDAEPKVDPNEDADRFGKRFSLTSENKSSVNPFLKSEIN